MGHEVMDAETVAGLFSVSTRQLRNYCTLGLPFEERDRKRVFHWPKALEWYVAFKSGGTGAVAPDANDPGDPDDEPRPGQKENLTQANLRKTRAEADLKQLVLAQKRGQVIGIAEARPILDRMFGNLKSQLLGAAPLLNTRLEGEPDSIARETAIRAYMENLCAELATGKIVRDAVAEANPTVDEAEDETIDSVEASAAPLSHTVVQEDEVTSADIDRAVVEFLIADAATRHPA